jgi:hypothetical protein
MAFRELGRISELKKPDGTPVIPFDTAAGYNVGVAFRTTEAEVARAIDPIKDGVSKVAVDPKKVSSAAAKKLPALTRNPMEDFATSTILWTIAALTPEQFNNPESYRDSPGSLKNIVFASGGRFDNQRVNTKFGAPEYFINNFVMNTIIGANEKTGNSNAIKFSFDIVEPQSMGLLLQSMQNAAVKAGYLSYLDNCPYVLRMDIQGFDELGVAISSIKPKFFVLKLVSMKFTVTEAGSTYKVEGIPYNHQAFSDAINVTYSDLKITGDINGRGVVSEVLQTSPDGLTAVLNRNEQKLKAENRITETDVYAIQFPKTSSDWYSSGGKPEKKNRAIVDVDEENEGDIALFGTGASKEADPTNLPINEIGESSLGFDEKSGGNPIFKRASDIIDEKTGLVKRDGMTIDPKARAFQFGSGQSLTAIMNQVVLSSKYAYSAINDKVTPQGYIKWFKLDAQVELLKYDTLTGDYAKKITYRVVPYFIHQSIFSNVTAAPVGYHELMKSVVKEYQYIYTGQNVDVLKFDININNLFFTGANPKPENQGSQTIGGDQTPAERLNPTTGTGQGSAPASQAAQQGRARPKRDPRLLKGYKGGSGTKSVEQNIAETMQQAFLSGNSADLISVDLEIMGDPYWLIDSGIANYFAEAPSPTSQITNDGTMNYESGNVYIYLTFRTPVDINETKGIYAFSDDGKESPFGGIYRVVACENTFSDGQWKQKLKCLRMPGPQGPEVTEEDKTGTVTPVNAQAVDIKEQEAPKTSPIGDTAPSTRLVNNSATTATNNNGTATTRTTSNEAPTRVGFRYYRDLGRG